MTQRMIPLDKLRFGHEAEPPINARRVGREEGIEELAQSITYHGLIQALTVATRGDEHYVADGNRRLAALRLMQSRKLIKSDELVKCDVEADFDGAEELSLAANIMRAPLHEADQYETFRELADHGMDGAQIASRFGIEPARVRRILALGRLSPKILDWWRAQQQTAETVQVVRAFTLAPSIEEQERVFDKTSKQGVMHGWQIREEFGAGHRTAARALKFVGVDAYVVAGGHVVEDLFTDDHAISDPALAARLAEEKLQAKAGEIAKEGWAWTALAGDLPSEWRWNWQTLQVSKKKATKEQKASSGAVVELDHDGKLKVTYGVVRPAKAKAAAPKTSSGEDAGSPEKPAPTISQALHHRLSIQATLGMRAALQEEPRIGLIALLAGMIAHRYNWTGSPIRVSHEGYGRSHGGEVESFASAFARLSEMTDEELFRVAAGLAGEACSLERGYTRTQPFDNAAASLAAAMDKGNLYVALRDQFDAADYFGGAPKPLIVQAIREALIEDEARKAEKLKKAELVDFAIANVLPTGWLPPELRAPTYPGPGAIPTPVAPDEGDAADGDQDGADMEDSDLEDA